MASLEETRNAAVEARKALRLRQEDVARRAQVSVPTLKAFEQGRLGEIGFAKLSRILGVLGLELQLRPASSARPTLDELRDEDPDD